MLQQSKSPAWNSQGRNFIKILRDRLFLKLVNADLYSGIYYIPLF